MSEKNEERNMNRVVLAFMAIVFLVLTGIFVKTCITSPDGAEVKVYLPWGLIAVFISFYLFREFNRVKRAKMEVRREELNARRQELLDNVIKAKKKEDAGADEDHSTTT